MRKLSLERIDYYLDQIVAYYTNQQGYNPNSQWVGGGAALLGLTGKKIDPATVRNLLAGFDPKGENRLVRNAGKDTRMPGFDLTFSAPKSLSYVWSIASPELRSTIEAIIQQAVERTIARIESKTKVCLRDGKGGKKFHAAKTVALTVFHHTARPIDENTRPDPALHIHVLFVNTGFMQDGRTGALDGLRILNKKKFGSGPQFALHFGEEFRKEVGGDIKAFGFDLRPTKIRGHDGWEIANIPKSELSRISKRSKQIAAAVSENATPGQRRAATLQTRHSKTEIEPSKLFAVWQAEAKARGITADTIEALRTQRTREIEREQARERMRSRGLSR